MSYLNRKFEVKLPSALCRRRRRNLTNVPRKLWYTVSWPQELSDRARIASVQTGATMDAIISDCLDYGLSIIELELDELNDIYPETQAKPNPWRMPDEDAQTAAERHAEWYAKYRQRRGHNHATKLRRLRAIKHRNERDDQAAKQAERRRLEAADSGRLPAPGADKPDHNHERDAGDAANDGVNDDRGHDGGAVTFVGLETVKRK